MYKIVLLALVLTGCASTAYEAADDESAFHKAALSWVGAPVTEMILRWGKPNNLEVEPSDNRDGLVRWRVANSTALSNSGAGVGGGHYTCIAEARYAMDGIITKVDTVSTNCHKRYPDERIVYMTR